MPRPVAQVSSLKFKCHPAIAARQVERSGRYLRNLDPGLGQRLSILRPAYEVDCLTKWNAPLITLIITWGGRLLLMVNNIVPDLREHVFHGGSTITGHYYG